MIKFNLTEYSKKHNIPIESIVGNIKYFANEDDPIPLREQFHKNYSFGGGWNPFEGFKMNKDKDLIYPDDLPLYPLATAKFRNQEVVMYQHAWVAIVEEDGSFEISRMD